jgi:hypothetical protein
LSSPHIHGSVVRQQAQDFLRVSVAFERAHYALPSVHGVHCCDYGPSVYEVHKSDVAWNGN